MLQRRDEALIPLCSSIEELIKYIEGSKRRINLNRDIQFLKKSYNCSKFLEAKERLSLDKKSRQMLLKYKNDLENFQKKIKKDRDIIFSLIRDELGKVLQEFSNEYFMDYGITFEKGSKEKIENAIINHMKIEGQLLLSGVTLIYNDDEENYRDKNYYFGSDFYYNIWGPIQSIYINVEDLDLSVGEEQTLSLYQHVNDNFKVINSKVWTLIQENNIDDEYINIIEGLNNIESHLINEIDKVYEL